jgi:hypothetical protein
MKGISWEGNDIEQTINTVLKNDPKFRDAVLSELYEMTSEFEKRYNLWTKMLEKHELSIMDLYVD